MLAGLMKKPNGPHPAPGPWFAHACSRGMTAVYIFKLHKFNFKSYVCQIDLKLKGLLISSNLSGCEIILTNYNLSYLNNCVAENESLTSKP